jgi:superfamily I DNA and/or RNA helicase
MKPVVENIQTTKYKIAEILNKQFYNYILEKNHISRTHNAVSVLYLQYVLQVMLLCK